MPKEKIKDYSTKYLIDMLSSQSGLYGLFANPGFGATTFSMQIARAVVDITGGTAIAFSLDLSKEQWCTRMRSIGLSLDRFFVEDYPCPTDQMIEETIKNTENVRIVVIDYLELLDENIWEKLSDIAKQYAIPILICGHLSRNSGDFDPNHRPELYSVKALFEPPFKSRWRAQFAFLALLHRNHDCDRGIGTAHHYNISNKTELIVKHNEFGQLGSLFFEWDEQKKCFKI